MNRIIIKLGAALSIFAALSFSVKKDTVDVAAHSAKLHQSIISMDTHTDTVMEMYRGKDVSKLQVNLDKMRKGGMDAVFFAAYVGQGRRDDSTLLAKTEYAKAMISNFKDYAQKHSDEIGIAYTASDVRKLKKAGKLIGIMAIENGYALGKDISNVQMFYDMGVRYITLSHNNNNDICDAAVTQDNPRRGFSKGPEWHGLSPFGVKVVEEMNRLGIIIDISHTSAETVQDCLEHSKAPIIASHSCCAAIKNHARNLTDQQIKDIAAAGGLIQVTTYHGFMADSEAKADIKCYCDHVEHVRDLVGVEHVGFGSDFDGGGGFNGCNDASEIQNITMELLRRGWSDRDIKLFWGENVLRVMGEVERVARNLR